MSKSHEIQTGDPSTILWFRPYKSTTNQNHVGWVDVVTKTPTVKVENKYPVYKRVDRMNRVTYEIMGTSSRKNKSGNESLTSKVWHGLKTINRILTNALPLILAQNPLPEPQAPVGAQEHVIPATDDKEDQARGEQQAY